MLNKIALVSDLHLDFWEYHYRQKNPRPTINEMYIEILGKCFDHEPDLVVIAGDVSNGYIETPFLHKLNLDGRSCMVMYVPGNHDYYGFSLPQEIGYVQNEDIVGTTLWTNFSGAVGIESIIYDRIADSAHIHNTSAIKVQQLANQSWDLIKMLDREVIVTHWPPSQQSTAERYTGDMINPYFVNNFDNEIAYGSMNSKLWLFGHVHHRHSYMLGDILCVCNPLGYPGEVRKSIRDYKPEIIEKVDGKWQVNES